MNIKWSLQDGQREVYQLSRRMEAKLERHAGLLLWTSSLIVAAGLALHQPAVPGPSVHLVGRLIPFVLAALLLLPPLRCVVCAQARSFALGQNRRLLAVSIAHLTRAFQHALVGALGSCLALFVLCLARRHFQDGFACLAMATMAMIALGESLHLEEWVAQSGNAGPVGWLGPFRVGLPAGLASRGLIRAPFGHGQKRAGTIASDWQRTHQSRHQKGSARFAAEEICRVE